MRTDWLAAVVLAAMGWIPAVSAASSPVRVDVTGRLDGKKIELAAVNGAGLMKGERQHWVKAGEPVHDLMFAGSRPKEEWREYSFSFTPAASGAVELYFCAQWAKEAADRGWVDLTGLRVNGEAAANGNFAEAAEEKGVMQPKGFWLAKKAQYLPNAGPDGSGAVRVNHDNRMHKRLEVEGGVTCVVDFKAKLADISSE